MSNWSVLPAAELARKRGRGSVTPTLGDFMEAIKRPKAKPRW